jgi:hypothetical protein
VSDAEIEKMRRMWEEYWGYLCGARDRKLVYLRAHWNPDEALAAAGVS